MDQTPPPNDPRDQEEATGESHTEAMQKFMGFILMVLSWLQLLVAVSSGSDADYLPFLFYFFGLVIFVNGTMSSPYKYLIMGAASLTGLALIYHIRSIGAATRWEKGMLVYGTILVVGYFIFARQKPVRRIQTPNPPP
jgi:hypothetical protein